MRPQSSLDLDPPLELDELDRAVLWALRCAGLGRIDCPSLRRTFVDLYGERAADHTLCGLLVLVRLLGRRLAGGLRLHTPGSGAISRDELMILAALAAAQDDLASGAARSGQTADGLGLDAPLARALLHVAGLLSARGRRLSAVEAPMRTVVGRARIVTLH